MRRRNFCSVEGCGGVHSGRGFCRKHYNQFGRSMSAPDRTRFTPNEIVYVEDHAEVVLLDVHKRETGRVLIDCADVDLVKGYRWGLRRDSHTGYAVSQAKGSDPLIKMHRLIMGLRDSKILVDHTNHNGLDNRRVNLRIATRSGNAHNSRPTTGESSQYKGVSWHAKASKWVAYAASGYENHYLGIFKDEVDAAMEYDRVAVKLHGEFACLNFPFLW